VSEQLPEDMTVEFRTSDLPGRESPMYSERYVFSMMTTTRGGKEYDHGTKINYVDSPDSFGL